MKAFSSVFRGSARSYSMPEEAVPPSSKSLSVPRRLKYIIFALIPAVLLFGGLELILRLTEEARPSRQSIPLPEELFGMLQPDATLMWSLQPSVTSDYGGKKDGYSTNRLGLRYREVSINKPPRTFRILSLGESTTYGYGVADDHTYSQQLEKLLNAADPELDFQVINAGVPAWSSFQSLIYLKEKGIKFDPDMVLFYHEFNDYLPTSWRSSDTTEQLGLSMTDREIYESFTGTLSRTLLAHSAIFRFVQNTVEKNRLDTVVASNQDDDRSFDTNLRVKLDDIGIPTRLVESEDGSMANLDESQLPRRVSSAERLQNLTELAEYCKQRGIELVIIHPSYRFTEPHDCLLTKFCRDHDVTLFDAHQSLHKVELPLDQQFLDNLHPTPRSHAQLAQDLFDFLEKNHLVPQAAKAESVQ